MRIFISCLLGSLEEGWHQGYLIQWFSDILKDPDSLIFLFSSLVLPLIVTWGWQGNTQQRRGSCISLFKSQGNISRKTQGGPSSCLSDQRWVRGPPFTCAPDKGPVRALTGWGPELGIQQLTLTGGHNWGSVWEEEERNWCYWGEQQCWLQNLTWTQLKFIWEVTIGKLGDCKGLFYPESL